MKKILSILTVLLLLLSIFAISVNAEENYCKLFQEQWSNLAHIDDYGSETDPWSADSIAYITAMNIDRDKYINTDKAQAYEQEYGYTPEYYSVPSVVFETLANKLFEVKVDIKSVNIDGQPSVLYDNEADEYDIIFKPAGGGAFYIVYGYSKLGDVYTVYMQKESDGEYLSEYAKATATCDGEYAKLISFEVIDKLPSKDGLITPPSTSSSDEYTSSSLSSEPTGSDASSEAQDSSKPASTTVPTVILANKYGVELSAFRGVFPEQTVVTISKMTDSETLSSIKNSLGEKYSKFVAFDFSATENGTAVHPNGKVTAIFELPVDYDMDNIAVLYVPDIGEVEAALVTVDKATRTVTAELSHFSTYVLAEIYTENFSEDNSGAKVLLIVFIVLIVILLLGGGAAWYFLVFRKKKFK